MTRHPDGRHFVLADGKTRVRIDLLEGGMSLHEAVKQTAAVPPRRSAPPPPPPPPPPPTKDDDPPKGADTDPKAPPVGRTDATGAKS